MNGQPPQTPAATPQGSNGKPAREPGTFICVDKAILARAVAVSPAAAALYVLLESYADDSRTCFPGIGTLATAIGRKRRYTQKLLRALEDAGVMSMETRIEARSQSSNLYRLPPIVPVNSSAPPRALQCAPGVNPSAPPLRTPVRPN